jgi:molecular chaperone GrpE
MTLFNRVREIFHREPETAPDRLSAEDMAACIAPLMERLERVENRLIECLNSNGELHQAIVNTHTVVQELQQQHTVVHEKTGGIQDSLETLQKQINRAGREQLKANSLAETQVERLTESLEMLRTADERREQDVLRLHEQHQAAQQAARLDVVEAILPVLDSLDEAVRSGHQLLEEGTLLEEEHAPEPASSTFLDRLLGRTSKPLSSNGSAAQHIDALRESLSAWLEGLTFVARRLLDVLSQEGVNPIETHNQAFDPQYHVAIEVVPASEDVPEGMIAAEVRRGYVVGERILRHAEVVVARNMDDMSCQEQSENYA